MHITSNPAPAVAPLDRALGLSGDISDTLHAAARRCGDPRLAAAARMIVALDTAVFELAQAEPCRAPSARALRAVVAQSAVLVDELARLGRGADLPMILAAADAADFHDELLTVALQHKAPNASTGVWRRCFSEVCAVPQDLS